MITVSAVWRGVRVVSLRRVPGPRRALPSGMEDEREIGRGNAGRTTDDQLRRVSWVSGYEPFIHLASLETDGR